MARVKRGVTKNKRRSNLLEKTKGYRYGRSTKEKQARQAWLRAGQHAFDHRRDKKGIFRRLWNVRLNAAIRPFGMSYSKLINVLKQKNIELNRKMLSEIADQHPETFERIVKKIS